MTGAPNNYATIEDRIMGQLDELTSSERKLASSVLEVKETLASFTAAEIAQKAGVSQATAVRFFRRLGYDSFAELKREARESAGWASPLYQISGTGPGRMSNSDLALHMAQDLKNMTQTAETISDAVLAETVEQLAGAKRIIIIGYRNSAAIASYSRNLLCLLHDNVILLPYAGMSISESLLGLGEGDVMLAVGFRRRPEVLHAALAIASEAGIPRILITDPSVTTAAKLASLTLRCSTRSASAFDSYAAAMSLVNHICARIGELDEARTIARLARFEALYDQEDGGRPLSS